MSDTVAASIWRVFNQNDTERESKWRTSGMPDITRLSSRPDTPAAADDHPLSSGLVFTLVVGEVSLKSFHSPCNEELD